MYRLRGLAHHLAGLDVQRGVRPLAQLRLVRLRRAEQRRDHHDREARTEVGDEVELARRSGELVEETGG